MPYFDNCYILDLLLFYVCHTPVLASPATVSGLYHPLFNDSHGRNVRWSQQFSKVSSHLVNICFLLPRSSDTLGTSTSDPEIYFWLPSTWYYFPWRVCCVCDGSTWLFEALPGHNEHAAYPGLEFPNPIL